MRQATLSLRVLGALPALAVLGLSTAFVFRGPVHWAVLGTALLGVVWWARRHQHAAIWQFLPRLNSQQSLVRWILVLPLLWVLTLCVIKQEFDIDQVDEYLRIAAGAMALCVLAGRLREKFWSWMILGQALSAVVLLAMITLGYDLWNRSGRYATFLVDPNSLGLIGFIKAAFLSMVMWHPAVRQNIGRHCKLPSWAVWFLLGAGALSAWAVCGLSGTRGAWVIALPWLGLLIMQSKRRIRMALCTVLVSLGLGMAAAQHPLVQGRIQELQTDVARYQQGQLQFNSVGIRLSIYACLLDLAHQQPWLGYARFERIQAINRSPILTADSRQMLMESGSHNQYLEKQVANGLPGGVLALLLYLLPTWLFARAAVHARRSGNWLLWVAGSWGAVVGMAYLTAGLSLILTLKYLNSFFSLSVAVTAASLISGDSHPKRHLAGDNTHV